MLFSLFERLIDPFKNQPDEMPPSNVWGFYWHYIRQIKGAFILLIIIGFFVAVIDVALFSFLGRIVDLVEGAKSPQMFFAEHRHELLGMALVALVARPVSYILHDLFLQQTLTSNFTTLIRWQNHRYVLKQSINFFHNDFAGGIANRIIHTGNALRSSAIQSVNALWHAVIYAVTTLVLFFKADWRLMLPLLIWILFYSLILIYFVPRTRERSTLSAKARSKLMGTIVDSYTNISTLKLFAHTAREEAYAQESMRHQTRMAQNSTRLVTAMNSSIILLNGFLIGGTMALSLWLWGMGAITIGAITLATGLVLRINNMSEWFMWVINGIFDDVGSVQDGIRTISQVRLVQDKEDAKPLVVHSGTITFNHIYFHYDSKRSVYEDIYLALQSGEKIGLVGPSGAGKSTLVNLLLRLYDVQQGEIFIDDQNIAEVTQDSLRAQIGMVTQDTALLHRTIRENLLYGKPDATDEEIMHALTRAKADEFIHELVDANGHKGLNATVGERGVKLSGGQRQRIAIARVLLKNAPILILDEATSALDSEVEAAIQESLTLLMENRTVIAIAHRLSTIAQMDRLIVLDHGKIVEMGSHAELLAQNGLYARLWQHQTGNFVGDVA